jgi:hypothetical protein
MLHQSCMSNVGRRTQPEQESAAKYESDWLEMCGHVPVAIKDERESSAPDPGSWGLPTRQEYVRAGLDAGSSCSWLTPSVAALLIGLVEPPVRQPCREASVHNLGR